MKRAYSSSSSSRGVYVSSTSCLAIEVSFRRGLQGECRPGLLAARDVVAERVRVGAELLGELERDPLDDRRQGKDRERLPEPRLPERAHTPAARFRHPCGRPAPLRAAAAPLEPDPRL